MTKKIYLEPLKSVLGRSIFHYLYVLQHSDADFLCFISSRPEVLRQKGVLKYLSKFTGFSGNIKMEHWPKMGYNSPLRGVFRSLPNIYDKDFLQ